MKKREVIESIYTLISPLLESKGFRLKKGIDGGFFRFFPGGYQCIGVSLVDLEPDFDFSLVLSIRLDVVEDIANKFNAAPAKYHARTATFATFQERFLPKGETKFTVSTEAEIGSAIAQLKPVIEERIIPFLDQTQNLETVAEAMMLTEIPKILPGGPNLRALAVAWMIQHPKFERIASTYKERIRQYPKKSQEELDAFIAYLRDSVPVRG
jgi:hypothetical protein